MRTNKILLIVVAAALPAFSQTLPQGVEKKATLGGITEYDYPYGMRVLLFADPSSPKVTVNMTYMVGSRFEGYGETGMAHLLEHMMFKGTTNHGEILAELNAHGAVNEKGSTVIRSRSDIEKVPIDALQAFYHKYYQPDNAMLVVAGKIDPAKTLGWINDTFGAVPAPTR